MMATIDRTGKLTFVDLNSDAAQIVSGKTVTFDSELERSLSFQVNGNTEQTTYSGNQLIDFSKNTYLSGNTTSTFTNDILTVSSTSGTYNRVEYNCLGLLKNNAS